MADCYRNMTFIKAFETVTLCIAPITWAIAPHPRFATFARSLPVYEERWRVRGASIGRYEEAFSAAARLSLHTSPERI